MRTRAAYLSALALLPLGLSGDPPRETPAGSPHGHGVYRRDLPSDPRAQAALTLESDARRRETRFRAVIDPGERALAARALTLETLALLPLDDVFDLGGEAFHHGFTLEDGYGAKDLPSTGRVHRGARGGPDARTCTACHWRGGPAGGGDAADDAYQDGDGETQSSAFARNPKSLVGAGVVELLAREMTRDLEAERRGVIIEARSNARPVQIELKSKGVSFGFLAAYSDGRLDTSRVSGVEPDLVVRPFGWKGRFASLRDAVEHELLVHHGIESDALVAIGDPAVVGPAGGEDPDGDGVVHEAGEGLVAALTLYVAMQELPVVSLPEGDPLLGYGNGRVLFESVGCGSCHVRSLPLGDTTYRLPEASAPAIDLSREGAEPRLDTSGAGTEGIPVHLYSDLRRHDMGGGLAEARADRGVPASAFVTPPLWGIARSRPYLHDGRAPDLDSAILAHGGEAQVARDKYAAMSDEERAPIRIFLASMSRARRLVTR